MHYAYLPAIICLLFGSAMVILETVLPGFGLPGISGIVLLCAGTYFLGKAGGALIAVIVMVLLLIALLVLAFSILHSAASGRLSRSKLFLRARDLAEHSNGTEKSMIGETGIATSTLRPAGIGNFDGRRMSVVSDGAFIEEGTSIVVIREEHGALVVHPVKET